MAVASAFAMLGRCPTLRRVRRSHQMLWRGRPPFVTAAVWTLLFACACTRSHDVAGSSSLLAAASGDAGVLERTDAAVTEQPALRAEDIGDAQLIASTFSLAESPIWDPCGKQLLFSDVNANEVESMSPSGEFGVFRANSNYANGLTLDPSGALLATEMGGGAGGRITRTDRAGNVTVLVDRTPSGMPLNTSDDLVRRSDGTIYFTDPVVAHGNYFGFSFTSQPLYRLTPEGDLVAEAQLALPNGVELSPDERTLYVADSTSGNVLRYDVAEDGSLSGESTFVSGLVLADSMCLDVAGNLYIGTSQGLTIMRPDGSMVKTIPVTGVTGVTNCGFGGDDGKTLYITAWTQLLKVEHMPLPGLDWAKGADIDCTPP